MPDTLTLTACAKINLTLDVFSKRADGYHSIATVMQAISLHDTLTFAHSAEPGIEFTCDAPDSPDIPVDASNLVVRAAQTVLDYAAQNGGNLTDGIRIHLVKRIPSQAGLGGGSSDAAAALRGTASLHNLVIPQREKLALAAEIGSDVPFFLVGGRAAARGRGESLTPLPDDPKDSGFWLVVVKPEASVSTAWAYGELDAIPERQSHRATKRMEEALLAGDAGRLLAFQSNDFELPVFTHHPSIAWLRDELQMAGAVTAHLCGSGAAVYGIAENRASAERISALLRPRYPRTFVARSLNRAESNPFTPIVVE